MSNTLDLFRLDGRRALITGASRGLGRCMALALADAGADIVITGRTAETLGAAADEIRARGTIDGMNAVSPPVRRPGGGIRVQLGPE